MVEIVVAVKLGDAVLRFYEVHKVVASKAFPSAVIVK